MIMQNRCGQICRNNKKYTNFCLIGCPKGFVSNIYQFQCYLFVEDSLSWYNALNFCENRNAYLAELIEPTERSAVWNYAKGTHVVLPRAESLFYYFLEDICLFCGAIDTSVLDIW